MKKFFCIIINFFTKSKFFLIIIWVYIQRLYISLYAYYGFYENYLYNSFYVDCFFWACYQYEKEDISRKLSQIF